MAGRAPGVREPEAWLLRQNPLGVRNEVLQTEERVAPVTPQPREAPVTPQPCDRP